MYEYENAVVYEYETEQVKLSGTSVVNRRALTAYDAMLNRRAREGWEFVHSVVVPMIYGVMVTTFRRRSDAVSGPGFESLR